MIAPVAEHGAPDQSAFQIAALATLTSSEGWALVVKIMNENIEYLEKGILTKVDPATGIALTDQEIEILRIKRSLNIDLRDFPKNYQSQLIDGQAEPENYDPYFKSKEEIDLYMKK